MSKFTLEAILFKISESRALVAEFLSAPDAVLARFPLTDDERAMLLRWDVHAIVATGVSPMVTMLAYTAVHGMVARPEYIRRMQGQASLVAAAA